MPWRGSGTALSVALLGGAVAGFIAMGAAGPAVSGSRLVALQMPWLVSAGMTGLCAVGTAVFLTGVYVERRHHALRRAQTDELIVETVRLMQLLDAATRTR